MHGGREWEWGSGGGECFGKLNLNYLCGVAMEPPSTVIQVGASTLASGLI